ncbi:MAG: sulfatase-like hydrolase/transferase [Phycisphaerae bacterium]|nr:sulfatase-like hydrolase/transferase [Phycisphaerae bacterium]
MFRYALRIGLAILVLAAVPTAGRAAEPASRPNILFIISDEHNAGVLGCYGNRIVQTPNIDRLAAQGVTFDAAYTNSPLCVPCRLSFTSGKYISRVSAWNNDCWLPSDDYPSIARVMTAAGYDSLLCGKMHYDATRRYGFSDVPGSPGNQSFKRGKGNRRKADDLTPPANKENQRFDDFRPGTRSGVLDHDLAVTKHSVEFLQQRKSSDKPFFMIAGYLAPHFPLIVPEKYWEPYKGKVPMPTIPPRFLDAMPLNYKHLRVGFNVVEVDPDVVRRGRELYYGLTQWVDEQIGEVLAALEASGQADNTVIIYTTDHGENLGEHGMWWKNCMYEHGARVPLIIHWPRRWAGGQRRAGACSLVDVVQTIAELGGMKTPADWDGDSMLAWLDNADATWKDFALSEYYAHHIASGFVMYRSGKYKYVYHTAPDAEHGPQRELYDLEADPGEFANLADRPEHKQRIEQMHAAMLQELGESPEATEKRCREETARGYNRPDKPPVRTPKQAEARRQKAEAKQTTQTR